jgi:mRNA interferase RelE/StbE
VSRTLQDRVQIERVTPAVDDGRFPAKAVVGEDTIVGADIFREGHEKIAAAVLEFTLGPLLENPYRVGRALRGELEGLHAARVGAYRVIYEIDEEAGSVTVLDVDHRGDVYRSR